VKDLSRLGRDLSRVIIVDNMEQNGLYYGPQLKEWVRSQAKE